MTITATDPPITRWISLSRFAPYLAEAGGNLLPDHDSGRQRLWDDALSSAFPNLVITPRRLTAKVHDIHLLRNRVAHLEPLFRTNVRATLRDILDVLRAIDTVPEQWVSGQQRVTQVLKARPIL
ncbi:hypothetical protein [Antribacter gilvus]|uniref:hypothetical protein n=1 Tax=Antribacter gilvus TaxID=2304675 RepID=UPI000F7AF46C|nr:hypothetical protein [Antribacter gilvus]